MKVSPHDVILNHHNNTKHSLITSGQDTNKNPH